MRIIKFIIFTAICFILFASAGAYYIFRDFNLSDALNGTPLDSSTKLIERNSLIDQDTLLREQDLRTFDLFSSRNGSYDSWIKELIEEGTAVRQNKSEILVKNEIRLVPLNNNDCQLVNCYQQRIEFNQIPSSVWKALIYIEDKRFLGHSGFDFYSIARALVKDLLSLSLKEGASTLTQQLVRSLFLTNEKSIERKVKEIIISYFLESKFDKDQIIQMYFNEVYWGVVQNVRLKGLLAASLFYFNKRPYELSGYESLILVSMLKGPSYYSPTKHLKRLRERTDHLTSKLENEGLLFFAKEDKWNDRDWTNWANHLSVENSSVHYQAMVHFLASRKHNVNSLFEDFESYVFVLSAKELERKLKIQLEENTMSFKAVLLRIDKELNEQEQEGFWYYSKEERSLVNAIKQEKHQIGSTIKPFIYSLLLESGLNWDEEISSEKITLKLKSGEWIPKEANDREESTNISLREALQKSKNIPLVRAVERVGFGHIERGLERYVKDLKVPLREFPSQILGSMELSLYDLAHSYEKLIKEECQKDSENTESVLEILVDPKKTTVRSAVSEKMSSRSFWKNRNY